MQKPFGLAPNSHCFLTAVFVALALLQRRPAGPSRRAQSAAARRPADQRSQISWER